MAKCAVKRLTGGERRRSKDNIKLDLRDVEVVRTGDDATDEGHVAWQTAVLAVCSLRAMLRSSATRIRHKIDPFI